MTERKEVYQDIRIDDLPRDCSTQYLIDRIKEADKTAREEGGRNLRWQFDYSSYYDDYSGYLSLNYYRPATDKELKDEAKYKKILEQREKAQYEALKKKFENKP